ncbi:hypothetical protein VPNG_09655 [Cytospora leucostoma]|uniref:F-box domain-containing protein n=1 Tax=Cytospora leucostoma TaxID=1230097 RepID=A0A423VMI1_9PEZI|nr:hypothetical protein VPNG_09655 [Cytospora leucostoma]
MADDGCEEKPFPFLSLPVELRNKIYRVYLDDDDDDLYGLYELRKPRPALLHVNKQLRAETLPIYFGGGPWCLSIAGIDDHPEDWGAFIKMKEGFTTGPTGQPGASSLSYITRLQVTYDYYHGCPVGFQMDNNGSFDDYDEDYADLQCSHDLDWTDMGAVQDALAATVTKAGEAMEIGDIGKQSAELGQLLWFFGKECPRAAKHTRIIF